MYNINGDFMAFDGLFLRHLLDLEKEKSKEARINSIGQIDNNYFVFSLWKNNAFNLIISLEPGNCYFNIDNSKVNVNNEYSHFLNILKTPFQRLFSFFGGEEYILKQPVRYRRCVEKLNP